MKKYVSLWICIVLLFGIMPMVHAEDVQIYAIKPQYDSVGSFKEGLAWVNKDGKEGAIDKTGEVVIKLEYDGVGSFSEGLAYVRKNGKSGFIDKTGREVVKLQYDADDVYYFSEGLAWVKKDGKWGFIDKTGKEVVKPQYEKAYSFSEGLAAVIVNGKWGFIDKTGKEVVKPQYEYAVSSFSEGLAAVAIGNAFGRKWGFIDKTGREIVRVQYEGYVNNFIEGLAGVCNENSLNNKCGFIDKTGKEVVKFQYQDVYDFSEGLALVNNGDFMTKNYGFIDKTGKEVIKPQYHDAWRFGEGLAPVEMNGKWGYIDKTGKGVVKPLYDNAYSFTEGLAAVKVNGKWGYIANPLDTPADMPAEWAKLEVDKSVASNLVPEDMQYGYEKNITRADFSRLVIKLLTVKTGKSIDIILADNGKTIDKTVFSDTTDISILEANALGIVSGKGNGIFDPNGNITRQEAAVMLTRTAKLFKINGSSTSTEFADSKDTASWAMEAVAFVTSIEDKTNHAKIMGSTGNNKFSPNASYTRQQAFITMKRIFNA